MKTKNLLPALVASITNFGAVFGLSFPAPQLAINSAGANVVVTWSVSYAG